MFTGHEDHEISLDDASAMTKRYRNQMNTGDIKGGFFSRDAILAILDQADCVGIRYYYGLDDRGKQTLILVGADTDENDLYTGSLMEFSIPCPTQCGSDNPLNS